ncbi:hypothetical protein T492DRAFT_886872 [Pavlovales sp. CCMP2436]|nr:hypothetical protein T492DRAFT_886872 [Pavlovales sp. CCMP2436]
MVRAVAAACDECTIGVVAILGNHYGGQYDPVEAISDALVELNTRNGWQREDLSVHVAVDVAYLGGKAESFTLNFSRPASGFYVQFYDLSCGLRCP